MAGSPVRRCVAVASHGRRCQQSPFRGSPYCWHHLQSRKVPAPSRPVERSARVTPIDAPGAEPLVSVDRMAIAMRLVNTLGTHTVTELVEFLESRKDGDFVVHKDGGVIQTSEHDRPRKRSAQS